jgi:hypothetical protein
VGCSEILRKVFEIVWVIPQVLGSFLSLVVTHRDHGGSIVTPFHMRPISSVDTLIFSVEGILWLTVSHSVLVSGHHLGSETNFSFSSMEIIFRPSRFFFNGRPFSQQDGSVFYSCCWASPAQSFFCLCPTELMTVSHCLNLETSPTWKARFLYLFPPGTGSPILNPGIALCLINLHVIIWHL